MTDNKILPEIDELVVATVESITGYGAYLRLEDYQCTAFLPISEVSTKWVRRISDVIRVGQRIVVKVIRVDKRTEGVDVSLKDVSPTDAKRTLIRWEKTKKAEKLISIFSEREKIDKDRLLSSLEALAKGEQSIYGVLERLVIERDLVKRLDLPGDVGKKFLEFLSSRIRPKRYAFRAVITVAHKGRGGIYKLKEFFQKLENIARGKGLETEITVIGTPRYLVRFASYRPEVIKKHAPAVLDEGRRIAYRLGMSYSVVEAKIEK